jgi:15-cis-phytoene synthase
VQHEVHVLDSAVQNALQRKADAQCRASIRRNSKSFALASLLLPSHAQDTTYALYAWCRRADDAVDEAPVEQRAPKLLQLQSELTTLYQGNTDATLLEDGVLHNFARAVKAAHIPALYPSELLRGMAMDVNGHVYASWDDLQLYCYRVASTVGLMMCHVLGVRDPAALPHAAQLGLAMQLTNICRDVHEDWQRGRLYLPDTLLAGCGAGGLGAELGRPLPRSAAVPLQRALREVLALADRHYRSAESGFRYLPLRCALAVCSARFIYAEIGRELERVAHNVFAPRVVVTSGRKLLLTSKAVALVLSRSGQRRGPNLERPLSEVPYAAELFAS